MQNLYTENDKTLLIEVKDDPNIEREIPQVGRPNIVMSVLPKVIYRFSCNANQISAGFFF